MTKQQWIERRAVYLMRIEGIARERAPSLAQGQADAHERVKGAIGPMWPQPDHATIFNTRPDREDA